MWRKLQKHGENCKIVETNIEMQRKLLYIML